MSIGIGPKWSRSSFFPAITLLIMEDELILQQAVELHLKGVLVIDIVQKLGRSRQWVHKWITRFRTESGDDWYHSKSTSPKQACNRTPPKEEELVIYVRKALAGPRYSQTGALSIMYVSPDGLIYKGPILPFKEVSSIANSFPSDNIRYH